MSASNSPAGTATTRIFNASPYALVDPNTGTPYSLMVGPNTIGRCDASVAAKDPSFINLYTPRAAVSRAHASIVIAPNEDAWLEDNNSTNGTMVAVREGEGLRLEPSRFYQLFDGTRIVFGEVEVVFVHLGSVSQHPNSLHNTAPSGNSLPAEIAMTGSSTKVVGGGSTTLSREGTGQQIASIIGQRCAEHQRVFSHAFLSPTASDSALLKVPEVPPQNPHSPLAPPSQNPPPSTSQPQRQSSNVSVAAPSSKVPAATTKGKKSNKSKVLDDAEGSNSMPEPLPSITKLQEEYQALSPQKVPTSNIIHSNIIEAIPPTLFVGEEPHDSTILSSKNTADITAAKKDTSTEKRKGQSMVVAPSPPAHIGVAIPYLDDEEEDTVTTTTTTTKAATTTTIPDVPSFGNVVKESSGKAEKDITPPTRTKGAKSDRVEPPKDDAETDDEKEPEPATKKSRKEPAKPVPKKGKDAKEPKTAEKEKEVEPAKPLAKEKSATKPAPKAAAAATTDKSPSSKKEVTYHEKTEVAASSTLVKWDWPSTKKVVACLSGMDAMEKEKLLGRINVLGGDVSEDWSPKVNILVVGDGAAARTPKFLMALGRGIPVVKMSLFFMDKSGLKKRGVEGSDLPSLLSSSSILREFTPSLAHQTGDRDAADIFKAFTKNLAVTKQFTKRPAAGCLEGITFSVVAIPAKTRPIVVEILTGCGATVAKTKKDEEKLLPKASSASTFTLTTTDHIESVYATILNGTGKVSI